MFASRHAAGECIGMRSPAASGLNLSVSNEGSATCGGVVLTRCDKVETSYEADARLDRIRQGQRRLERCTAGCPGSKFSESLSLEALLLLMEGSELLQTENDFKKSMLNNGKGGVVDYTLASPDGSRFGCSVTALAALAIAIVASPHPWRARSSVASSPASAMHSASLAPILASAHASCTCGFARR